MPTLFCRRGELTEPVTLDVSEADEARFDATPRPRRPGVHMADVFDRKIQQWWRVYSDECGLPQCCCAARAYPIDDAAHAVAREESR